MTAKEKLTALLEEMENHLKKQPYIELTPKRSETTVFDSKLGGTPYLPKDFPYPTVERGKFAGMPLKFLAQLNFEKLPHIPDFPEKGILQFYCGCDGDDLIGLDGGGGYRVIYHKNIITGKAQLVSSNGMPKFYENDYCFPFEGEFKLEASLLKSMSVTVSDYRFEETVTAAYNKLFGTNYNAVFGSNSPESIAHNDEKLYDELYDFGYICGSRIGGFPYFTQQDPRNEDYGYDVLLFQLDSDDGIMWGDSGVANFFISREKLKNCDFSDVLYNWDCC